MSLDSEAIKGVMQIAAMATPMVMGAFAKRDAKERAIDAAKEANELGKQLAAKKSIC